MSERITFIKYWMDVPQTCRRRAAATQVENSLSQFGLRQHVTNMFEFRVLFIPSLLIPSSSCCHHPKQQAGIDDDGAGQALNDNNHDIGKYRPDPPHCNEESAGKPQQQLSMM